VSSSLDLWLERSLFPKNNVYDCGC
jgi:hypothetical protein